MQNGHVALEVYHWPANSAVDLLRGAHIVRFHNSPMLHGSETAALEIPHSGGWLTYAIGESADSFGVANRRSRLTTLRLSHEDTGQTGGDARRAPQMFQVEAKEPVRSG